MIMYTCIAFLRGINVGGKNKIPMSELRAAIERNDFKSVRTYIQSGNVVFESSLNSCNEIAASIRKTIQNAFGIDIPVLVKTKKQLEYILLDSPYDNEDLISTNKTYFVLLFELPNEGLIKIFNSLNFKNEQFQVSEGCVHLLCENGYGKAKLNNNLIESKLKVIATTRNYRTLQKIIDL